MHVVATVTVMAAGPLLAGAPRGGCMVARSMVSPLLNLTGLASIRSMTYAARGAAPWFSTTSAGGACQSPVATARASRAASANNWTPLTDSASLEKIIGSMRPQLPQAERRLHIAPWTTRRQNAGPKLIAKGAPTPATATCAHVWLDKEPDDQLHRTDELVFA
jgi:hypothetical protein